ncbi:putative inorganic phosphate cotransporter, partial [Caerostris darwini]
MVAGCLDSQWKLLVFGFGPVLSYVIELPGVRYLFALNAAIGYCAIYALRMNISVAIVAMVNQTAIHDKPGTNVTSDDCPAPSPHKGFSNSTEISEDGEFVWSREMQGVVLGAFYYGYCFSDSWWKTCRSVQRQVGVRCYSTSDQQVWSDNGPLTLRKGVLNTLVYAGVNVIIYCRHAPTAFLCDSGLFGGWPSAFYIIGLFGCLWFIMWSTLVTDSPLTHPLISKEELRYITSNQKVNHTVKAPPVPWKKIMLSVPFWIVVLCKTCQDWSFYTMMTDLPTFFGTVLHFPIQENGFFSSLPHVIQTIVGLIVSFVADFLIRRGIFSLTFVRKFCNSV